MQPEEEPETEEIPDYPTANDIPNPDHHQGPVGPSQTAYDADALNFLADSTEDSFYPDVIEAIRDATTTIKHVDALGGRYPVLTLDAASRLVFLANKYVKAKEYVITNIKDQLQFRAVLNDFRIDAANAKTGLRRIDYNNTFMSFIVAMENHLKGAKLTRSYAGFERTLQQTQRAELTSSYEHKKPPVPSSGLSRLFGRG